jgi:hypothetical protein
MPLTEPMKRRPDAGAITEMLHTIDSRLRLVELCPSARRARLLPAPGDDEVPQQERRGRPRCDEPATQLGRVPRTVAASQHAPG